MSAVAALLLATVALAVLSIHAVRREALVRKSLVIDTHTSVADLVSARMDEAMAPAVGAIAAAIQQHHADADALLKALHGIETANPWMQPLVVIARDSHRKNSAAAVPRLPAEGQKASPAFDSLWRTAEREEFQLEHASAAADLYAKAATQAPTPAQRAEALNGQARAQLNAGYPARARETYTGLIASAYSLDPQQAKWSMLAHSQVLECDTRLRDAVARAADALDLYRFLIDHRFVLGADAYDFYSRRVAEAVTAAVLQPVQKQTYQQLQQRDDLLDEFAKLIREQSPEGETRAGRDTLTNVGFVLLDDADSAGSDLFIAYPLEPRNLTALLARLLAERGPWSGLGIALLDLRGKPAFASVQPVPADAQPARAVMMRAPGWRIAAFPSSGSLDALASRDVTRYAAWLILVFGTVVTALVLAARSVSRELTLSRLRADFVASVSHELKTPLSLIRMFAESLREGWVAEEQKRDYYEVITRESERLTDLINNVLDFSRIESGTRQYRLATRDLREIVVDLVDRYEFHLRAARIELVKDVAHAPAFARVDRDAIEQVIVNLLSNAVKYMGDPERQPRQVRVSLTRDDAHLLLCVSDTGIGMSDEQRTHIFERYYRADDERVRSVPGSGLGLTLVKAHVEAHAGTIAVKSVPGEGSTFAVTLPLAGQGAES